MTRVRKVLIWVVFGTVITVPIFLALTSPLLAWRDPIYVLAGLSGVIALALLLFQPLLVSGSLPGLSGMRGRHVHRWTGAGLVIAIVVHVAALWITSPPDVVDALLLSSPTPFSVWGVVAMWTIFAAGVLAALRYRLRPRIWRRWHVGLVVVAIMGSIVHAVLIEGTMETISKVALCTLVFAATMYALRHLGFWSLLSPRTGRK